MKIEVRNNCTDYQSYRAARVKSLFNVDSGANFSLDADLPIDDDTWKLGVIVGPSGSGKTSLGRSICVLSWLVPYLVKPMFALSLYFSITDDTTESKLSIFLVFVN